MIIENETAKKMKKDQLLKSAIQKNQERKIRGSVGRVGMYTAPQVAFLNDLKLNSLVKKLKQKQHMVDLQK